MENSVIMTVSKVLNQLETEGVIYRKRGSGSFIDRYVEFFRKVVENHRELPGLCPESHGGSGHWALSPKKSQAVEAQADPASI